MEWLKSKFEFYEVSNEGLVRSVDKMVKCKGNSTRVCKGKLLKMVIDKDGYYTVCIHDNGAQFPYFVHRLVAEAFIPNSDNLPVVDHINGNRQDNRVENLRWFTVPKNNSTELARKRKSEAARKREDNKKQIIQYAINGGLIGIYNSTMEAERNTNVDHSTIIRCCKNKQKTAGGYIWKYKN